MAKKKGCNDGCGEPKKPNVNNVKLNPPPEGSPVLRYKGISVITGSTIGAVTHTQYEFSAVAPEAAVYVEDLPGLLERKLSGGRAEFEVVQPPSETQAAKLPEPEPEPEIVPEIQATDGARNLAKAHDIDLDGLAEAGTLVGTGKDGVIKVSDVKAIIDTSGDDLT